MKDSLKIYASLQQRTTVFWEAAEIPTKDYCKLSKILLNNLENFHEMFKKLLCNLRGSISGKISVNSGIISKIFHERFSKR